MRMIIKWLICCISLYIALLLFPNHMVLDANPLILLGAGTVLWLVNIFIRPIAQIVSIIATLLTLGLFSIIVNAAMVSIMDKFIGSLYITSFWVNIFIAVLISIGNMFLAKRAKR